MRNLTRLMFPNRWTYTYLHSLLFLAAFTATAYAYDRSSVLATSTIFGTNCSIRTEIIPSSKIALFRLEYFEDRENDMFSTDSSYAGPLILNNSNLINYPQISETALSDCGVEYDVGSFSLIAEFSGSPRTYDNAIRQGFQYTQDGELRGVVMSDAGVTSTASAPPAAAPGAPGIIGAMPGNGTVTLGFTGPDNDGGAVITDYEYQLDGGSWVSAGTTSSPLVITGLTNGTSYSIKLRAVNSAGKGAESSAVSATPDGTAPTVAITGPTGVVTEAFTVTFTFSEVVTGFASDDVTVTNGIKGALQEKTNGKEYTLVVTPDFGKTVSILVAMNAVEDAAGNGNEASNTFEVIAGAPASEFEKYREEIRQVLVDDAARSLSSTLSANQRMMGQARTRFVEGRRQMDGEASGLVSRNNSPFDIDGSFELSGATLSTRGNFFEQTGNYEGTYRRLVFGDFDIQRDADTDSTTASLTARIAWEHVISDQTMLGYFVGGRLARSTLNGAFDGDQNRLGLTVGGYAVHQLDERVFLDAFATLGVGNNDLEMTNDVLALESDYSTRTVTVGAAISGAYEHEQYEFRPELAFSYGKTWIGTVGFTGRAYGLVDNTLSLDAGTVAIVNLTLRPEVIWALDADTVADSNSQFSFAPRLICESRKTVQRIKDCGGGAEIALSSQSDDRISQAEFRVVLDKVGGRTRSSLAFNVEHRF